jgi:hypothetical protein
MEKKALIIGKFALGIETAPATRLLLRPLGLLLLHFPFFLRMSPRARGTQGAGPRPSPGEHQIQELTVTRGLGHGVDVWLTGYGLRCATTETHFNMSKSEARKRVSTLYPNSFFEDRTPDGVNDVTLVVVDWAQVAKGLIVSGKTWGDVAERGLADVMGRARSQYPRATTFVITTDYYPDVDITKAPTQDDRTQQNEAGEGQLLDADGDPVDPLADFVCGPAHAPVPDEWRLAIHHRAKWFGEIVRFFARHWMTMPFGRDMTILVDGHYLQPGDLEGTEEHDVEVLQRTPLRLGDNDPPALMPHLHNSLGEGDFSIPFFLRMLSEDHVSAAVLSIDTDLMSILLTLDTTMRLYWRFWPRLSFMANTRGFGRMAGKNMQKWCDISELKQDILSDQRLMMLKAPVTTLCATIAASGGDYTDPIKRVTPAHFINTLLANAQFIGDVCDDEGTIDRKAHERLVRCACKQSTKRTLYEAAEGCDLDCPGRTPPRPDILHRRRHLEWYMSMLRQTGRSMLELGNPRLYGYARVDRSQPLSRTNIMRLHGTDAPDDRISDEEPEEPEEPEGVI